MIKAPDEMEQRNKIKCEQGVRKRRKLNRNKDIRDEEISLCNFFFILDSHHSGFEKQSPITYL